MNIFTRAFFDFVLLTLFLVLAIVNMLKGDTVIGLLCMIIGGQISHDMDFKLIKVLLGVQNENNKPD